MVEIVVEVGVYLVVCDGMYVYEWDVEESGDVQGAFYVAGKKRAVYLLHVFADEGFADVNGYVVVVLFVCL